MPRKIPELVCPAGNLPALKTAIDNGADTVYLGLKDATNARNFPGLNFTRDSVAEGIAYAHARGRQVLMAINTFVQAGQMARWQQAVDTAASLGADAVIVADPAVLAYASEKHPGLRLHMSVQSSATNYEAINLMQELFGIRRVVLPRVLTIEQVQQSSASAASASWSKDAASSPATPPANRRICRASARPRKPCAGKNTPTAWTCA